MEQLYTSHLKHIEAILDTYEDFVSSTEGEDADGNTIQITLLTKSYMYFQSSEVWEVPGSYINFINSLSIENMLLMIGSDSHFLRLLAAEKLPFIISITTAPILGTEDRVLKIITRKRN